jgi:hypothetical protein
MLRIDFPGYSGQESLQEITWNEWFRAFDDNGLAFLHQDRTADGAESRFNKLVSRSEAGSERGGGGRSRGSGGGGGRSRADGGGGGRSRGGSSSTGRRSGGGATASRRSSGGGGGRSNGGRSGGGKSSTRRGK